MKVPQIRFKGFNDEWEERKLGTVLKYEQPQKYIVKNTNYVKAGTPVLTAGQSFILGYTLENYGIKKATTQEPVIIFDDFTTSNHYVNFPFKVKSSALKILYIENYDKYNFYFINLIMECMKFEPQNHERHWINKFSKIITKIPTLSEQTKIGSLFSKIDDKISSTQAKVDKLKTMKQALLNKCFPQDDKKVPDVRFKGFNDEWEEKKLGEIAYITKGTQLNKNQLFKEGKYYVLNGGMTPSGYTNNYNTEANTISISEGGNSCGFVCYNAQCFWSGGHNYTLLNLNLEKYYLYQHLKYIEPTIMELRVGSGLPNIQKNALKDILLIFPHKSEQTKIGSLFSKLDDLISLHSQKLEKLKNIKSALLSKMFL